MAFTDGTLVRLATHDNKLLNTMWLYKEDATVANISASGYFNSVTGLLSKGDVITVVGNNGTAFRQVTSNTGAATVTVGAMTA